MKIRRGGKALVEAVGLMDEPESLLHLNEGESSKRIISQDKIGSEAINSTTGGSSVCSKKKKNGKA